MRMMARQYINIVYLYYHIVSFYLLLFIYFYIVVVHNFVVEINDSVHIYIVLIAQPQCT